MGLKTFNNWINESENGIVNDDFARSLESDVKLLKKIVSRQNASRGLTSKLIDVYGPAKGEKSYIIKIPMNNDLNKEINSL